MNMEFAMSRPRILVTGATGRTGGVVVSELLKAGFPVRALVRRDDARSAALRSRGVEIAVGEMTDVERVTAAMQGVQRAYWLPPYDPSMLVGAAVFATAARHAHLESAVVLSQWLASPSHPALPTRLHWLTDRLFETVPGLAVTTVNPGLFADAPFLATIGLAAHLGVMPWFFGDGQTAPPSVDDIGRVAAAALMDPARHAGRSYRPTGPHQLCGADMAYILGRVFDRRVRLVPTPLRVFLKGAHMDGHPLLLLASMKHYVEEFQRGTFALGTPNDDVQRATGRAPETFEAVARRYAALPENRRSAANTLRTFARFMATPFVSLPNLDRYMRSLQAGEPAKPQYTDESPVWQREHGEVRSFASPSQPRLQPTTESSA
jgi:uncharacterized protein YbjT (DUF2867 family)